MKKIISLFQRNYEGDRLVRDEVVPGAEWVLAGEGWATRKYDGMCCAVIAGILYKRYDAKGGKTPPPGFLPAQDPDPVTGHWPGWLMVDPDNPGDQYFIEAFHGDEIDGTYELCGPKVQGNPEGLDKHTLISHALAERLDAPRTFTELKAWLSERNIEGIVWHCRDGRMVKVKKKDFGLKRMEKTK